MDFQSTTRTLFERLPNFLQHPSVWVPVIVAFYVGLLGLCLSGALQRQKAQIQRAKDEKKAVFTMLDEDKKKVT